jgi:hypothetical protein
MPETWCGAKKVCAGLQVLRALPFLNMPVCLRTRFLDREQFAIYCVYPNSFRSS